VRTGREYDEGHAGDRAKGALLGASNAELGRLIRRHGPTALLKGVGVAGLAGAIVMVMASAFSPIEQALQASDAPYVAASSGQAEGETAVAAAPVAPPDTTTATAAVSPNTAEVATLAPPAVSSALAPAPATAPAPIPDAGSAAGASEPSPAMPDMTAAAAKPTAQKAADCPADATDATQPSEGACEGGERLPQVATALVEEPPLPEAVAAAAEEAGDPPSDPALPRPRPEPPAAAPVVKKASWGKLPPPPNCGSKHARWRYNAQRQPVWYCK
jgi:cytoskeletal protein RodZ